MSDRKPLINKRTGKRIGRLALALATGGASEVIRGVKKGVETGDGLRGLAAVATGGLSEVLRAPGRVYPQRKQAGRILSGHLPPPGHRFKPHGGASLRDSQGASLRPKAKAPPPPPPGRVHLQRRFTARAKAGLYKHLKPGDLNK